jgi:heat shock protein HtpX
MILFEELPCYVNCAQRSEHFNLILLLVLLSLSFFALRRTIKSPSSRLLTFSVSQILALLALLLLFASRRCENPMYTMLIYGGYVFLLTPLTLVLPRCYDKILIRHLKAEPISEIVSWAQEFVDGLSSKKRVYWYDSAVPKAFASGNSIFLSMGLLELLDDDELRAVLAHEVWHLTHNSKTPLLRQLALMTFTPGCRRELEELADEFAARIVGREAVISARWKLA